MVGKVIDGILGGAEGVDVRLLDEMPGRVLPGIHLRLNLLPDPGSAFLV